MSDWRDEAACLGMNPDLFFPDQGDYGHEARKVCAGCPVLESCRSWAIVNERGREGIWGGLSGSERQRVRMGAPLRDRNLTIVCAACGVDFPNVPHGAPARFCSKRCRNRASDRRRAGLPERDVA